MKPQRPRLGQLEVDCRTAPVPQAGTFFDVTIGHETVRAKVLNVSRITPPQPRSMGIVSMVATHHVEFVVS